MRSVEVIKIVPIHQALPQVHLYKLEVDKILVREIYAIARFFYLIVACRV